MSWAKIDDQLHAHHKIKRAWKSRPALGLHLMALSYSACYDLAGRVPVEFVEEKLPHARERNPAVTALLEAGMWEHHDNGRDWQIHDWDEYNGTAKTREEIREAKSAAGKKGAAARWGDRQTDSTAIAGCHDAAMPSANGTDMAPSPSPFPYVEVDSPNHAGGGADAARTSPLSITDERQALADHVVGVLERGIDSLTTDEPCKRPTRAAVLAVLGSSSKVAAIAAATEARSIAQSQNRAPNIVALFAAKLKDQSKALEAA